MTTNSVEPKPVSPSRRKSTKAVFPFSRHGVIRANSVSPLRNFDQPFPDLASIASPIIELVDREFIGTNGFLPSRGIFVVGSNSITSAAALTSQPSGARPTDVDLNAVR